MGFFPIFYVGMTDVARGERLYLRYKKVALTRKRTAGKLLFKTTYY